MVQLLKTTEASVAAVDQLLQTFMIANTVVLYLFENGSAQTDEQCSISIDKDLFVLLQQFFFSLLVIRVSQR